MLSRRFLLTGATGTLAGMAASWADPVSTDLPQPLVPLNRRATVSLIHGEDRRKNIYEALKAIDAQIAPVLKTKKYVVIKPNNVSTVNQLASTHADALRGILDYLGTRFKGPVIIAESSAGDTMSGFESFRYGALAPEYRKHAVKLVDLNAEGTYEVLPILDANLHLTPVRLAARLLDPDAYVISAGILKTHNVVVATMGIKNMALGAPLHQPPKETKRWNDKRKYHAGVRQTHYDILLTAQRLSRNWNLSVIDGFEGMEGNGPSAGTPVPSRIAIASTDFVAADRVGLEAMGVNAGWPAYLLYCWQVGLGQYDLKEMDIIGEGLAAVRKSYRLHGDLDRELQWMGPMTEIPPRLG